MPLLLNCPLGLLPSTCCTPRLLLLLLLCSCPLGLLLSSCVRALCALMVLAAVLALVHPLLLALLVDEHTPEPADPV